MADPITLSDEIIRQAQTATVYLRQRWADDWTEKPFLYCDAADWLASPSISSAQLSWTYGRGIRQGESTVGTVEPLDVNNWFIKIVFDQGEADDLIWYGLVDENTRRMSGDLLIDSVRVATGHQTFLCRGLLALLDRQIVRTAWCADGSAEYRVHRGLEFNAPNRSDDVGNMTPAIGPRGKYLFADDLETAWAWTSYHIVGHLLDYHNPLDRNGDKVIWFDLHNDAIYYLPKWDSPRLATHGRSVKSLLDAIMNRRRGLSYTVEVDEAGGVANIRPFTFLDADVSVSGGHILNRNKSQKTIDFSRTPDVASAKIRAVGSRSYDQVVAFGRQVTVCETISAQNGSIVAHWDTGALQTAYNEGASNEGDYPDATKRAERRQRNVAFRSGEEFSRVYSHFGPDDDWKSAVDTDVVEEDAFYLDVGLNYETDRVFYRPTQRFERHLPLKTDHVYPQAHALGLTLGDVTNLTPSGKAWEYLRPIVAMTLHDDLPSTTGKWAEVDKLPVAAGIEGTGDGHGQTMGCAVRMQNDALGFVLRVNGQPQWAIADTDFTAPDNSDLGGTYHPIGEYDWKDDLAATVASKADVFVNAAYPDTITAQSDAIRILYLDASAKAGLDILIDDTVVDVMDGDLIKTGNSTYYIRDDRETLEQIARIGYEWYVVPRQTLTVVWNQIENAGLFSIGDLITTIGGAETEESIRTAITSIRIEMAQSAQANNRLTIQTQWADLDLAGIY